MSAPQRASAELLADRGEAAAGGEFFRSRQFLDAEGVTHTLRIHHPGGDLLAPLIVREIPREPHSDAAATHFVADQRPQLRTRVPREPVKRGEADRLLVAGDEDRVLAILA